MQCHVCSSEDLELIVHQGNQLWCTHFLTEEEAGKEPYHPFLLMYGNNYSTGQLNYTFKKEIMFGNQTYLSGVTQSLSDHFEAIARKVDDLYFKQEEKKSVLDIGFNDGTQIRY